MGESVCLVRSFSQPASRDETNEVDSRRVLTESVSFGRFASESLQWEKWSAFTQNRYLEEVERFTKPGSVAQKKAFFEAHFKNRAAGRATQTTIDKVEVKASDEIGFCQVLNDNLVDTLEVDTGMAMNEARHREVSNAEVVSVVPSISVIDSAEPLVANIDTAMDEVMLEDVSNAEVDSVALSIEEVKVTSVDSFNSMEVVPEEKSTSLIKERRPSSSGSKACSRSSKLEPSFHTGVDLPLKKTRKEPPLRSKRSISVSKTQNRSPLFGKTEKDIAEIPQDGSRSNNNAKGAGIADKKKRSGSSSDHMSLNFASSARQTTKAAPKELARESTTQETTSSNARNGVLPNGNEPTGVSKSRKRPLSRTATEGSKAAKCSNRASAVRLSEFPPSSTLLSEDKRKNSTIGSRVLCRIPNNVQRQPSAGSEDLSTHSRSRAKSITVSSPFNFRSDERAEKRKEFFKKVEEERNKREHALKEQLSCGFKPNQNIRLASGEHKKSQTGGSQVPPVSLTSPRFCRNQISGKKTQQPFHKTKKKTQETFSPNILRSEGKHKSETTPV